MATLVTRFLGASALLAMLIAGSLSLHAQNLSPFTLKPQGNLTQMVPPGGYYTFFVTVKNTGFGPISMRIVRTQNTLPDTTWLSAICTGVNCYANTVDTTPLFTVKAGDSETTELTITAGGKLGDQADIKLQYDMGPGTEAQELAFSLKVSNASSVPVAPPVANALIYPNPTSGKAHYDYTLSRGGNVSMEVASITGKQVLPPASGYQDAGPHSFDLDFSGLPNGVYMVTMRDEAGKSSKLVTVAR